MTSKYAYIYPELPVIMSNIYKKFVCFFFSFGFHSMEVGTANTSYKKKKEKDEKNPNEKGFFQLKT